MFVVSLVVIISAVDCLKRLVSEMTCYLCYLFCGFRSHPGLTLANCCSVIKQ